MMYKALWDCTIITEGIIFYSNTSNIEYFEVTNIKYQ